jgi:carboxylesterase type B
MLGECRDERYLYAVWFPPKANTLSALRTRLIADYPERIVDAVLPLHYPNGQLPSDCKDWVSDAWGKIYAEMQVHHMQRGFIHALTSNTGGVDASSLLYRYRIEYRAKCTDKALPIEWGVTHSSDYPLWFWGNGDVLNSTEKKNTYEALIGPLDRFVQGPTAAGQDGFGWGTSGQQGVRTFKPDGTVKIERDAMWNEGVDVWKKLRQADQSKPKL